MKRACLAILLGIISSTALAGPITVTSDWVTWGDLAGVEGDLGDTPVLAAPPAGDTVPLGTDFLIAQADALGVPHDFTPGETVWISRAARPEAVAPPPLPSDDQLPVLARDVSRGEVITVADIEWIDPDPRRRTGGFLTEANELVGMAARRTLRAGRFLKANDIQKPFVIEKGEPVQLVYETHGLRLTVDARALSSAARGEPVRVVNLQSSRSMDAVAWAPGEARVQRQTLKGRS